MAGSTNSRSGTRISEGPSAASAEDSPATLVARHSTSPVESSTLATAAWPPRTAMAARRFAPRASSRPSSVSVPGVTTRTTSRWTTDFEPRFLASAGFSICSQTATLKPARISLAR